jgi:hypothetical protein
LSPGERLTAETQTGKTSHQQGRVQGPRRRPYLPSEATPSPASIPKIEASQAATSASTRPSLHDRGRHLPLSSPRPRTSSSPSTRGAANAARPRGPGKLTTALLAATSPNQKTQSSYQALSRRCITFAVVLRLTTSQTTTPGALPQKEDTHSERRATALRHRTGLPVPPAPTAPPGTRAPPRGTDLPPPKSERPPTRQRRNLTQHHDRANRPGAHPLTDQQTASALPSPPARPWQPPSRPRPPPPARPRAGPQEAPTAPQRSQAPPARIPETPLLRRQQAQA